MRLVLHDMPMITELRGGILPKLKTREKMKMNTKSISILAQGFVLSDFLTYFMTQLKEKPNQSIKGFYETFETRIGSQHSPGRNILLTPGSQLGLMYLMIVFPQQAFSLTKPELNLFEKLSEWGNPDIKLWNDSDKKELRVFIRRLRNAISHGRVKIDENMDVIFEDAPSRTDDKKNKIKNEVDFRIKMSLEGLNQFTAKLAREFKLDQEKGGGSELPTHI